MYFCTPSASSDRKESFEGELKKARNKDIERMLLLFLITKTKTFAYINQFYERATLIK